MLDLGLMKLVEAEVGRVPISSKANHYLTQPKISNIFLIFNDSTSHILTEIAQIQNFFKSPILHLSLFRLPPSQGTFKLQK